MGANFVAADGSVHMVSDYIDLEVYRALCTRDGRETVSEFFSTH